MAVLSPSQLQVFMPQKTRPVVVVVGGGGVLLFVALTSVEKCRDQIELH